MDLTAIPSFQTSTVLVLLAELGTDFAHKFNSAKRFASWLGLCPDILRHSVDVTVMQAEPKERHLLLLVRKAAAKPQLDRFLCGHD